MREPIVIKCDYCGSEIRGKGVYVQTTGRVYDSEPCFASGALSEPLDTVANEIVSREALIGLFKSKKLQQAANGD